MHTHCKRTALEPILGVLFVSSCDVPFSLAFEAPGVVLFKGGAH